jgi:hypothetical protein
VSDPDILMHIDPVTRKMTFVERGLTAREYMATEFAVRLASEYGPSECAVLAIGYADALLAELSK